MNGKMFNIILNIYLQMSLNKILQVICMDNNLLTIKMLKKKFNMYNKFKEFFKKT